MMIAIFKALMAVICAANLFFFIRSIIRREHWRTHMISLPMGNLGASISSLGILLGGPFMMIGIYVGAVIVLTGVYIAKRRSKAAGLG